MLFDENTTVNANELLKLVESSCYAITYLHEGTVKNAYGMTLEDFERILKEATFRDLRQKVITGLEHCIRAREGCDGCPYFDNDFCITYLKHDALKVLK